MKQQPLKSKPSYLRESNGRQWVPLPRCPQTGSPVPWLTSLHADPDRGEGYGDAKYRGNCSGNLIRDVLEFFQPQSVLDPMAGSGTCRDVCRSLNIPGISLDLKSGFDATDSAGYLELPEVEFVWLHPPYWRMIRYSEHPRCLSNAEHIEVFEAQIQQVIRNCAAVLAPAGKLAILIGDYKEQGKYQLLPFRVLNLAIQEGFWPVCPEIVRFSHGATSSRKVYQQAFIPRLHDLCFVLSRTC